MISIKINPAKQESLFDFPVIMKSTATRELVLFTESTMGTVIDPGNSSSRVGFFDSDWTSCYDQSQWIKFHGEIILNQ
jgi:hypothetical protein